MAKYDVTSGLSDEEQRRREDLPHPCPRDCPERFRDKLSLELHLANDHEIPWESTPEDRRP